MSYLNDQESKKTADVIKAVSLIFKTSIKGLETMDLAEEGGAATRHS